MTERPAGSAPPPSEMADVDLLSVVRGWAGTCREAERDAERDDESMERHFYRLRAEVLEELMARIRDASRLRAGLAAQTEINRQLVAEVARLAAAAYRLAWLAAQHDACLDIRPDSAPGLEGPGLRVKLTWQDDGLHRVVEGPDVQAAIDNAMDDDRRS